MSIKYWLTSWYFRLRYPGYIIGYAEGDVQVPSNWKYIRTINLNGRTLRVHKQKVNESSIYW